MHFSGGINRPPYETADGYLQTAEGCSHNTCLFCTYFKDQKFRKSTIEEIEEDIKEIPATFGAPKRIFLQGADGYAADYDVLMKKIMNVKEVSNYEKSVKATGSMVDSINSINDTKIDKLNQLMRNMIQFGETMDDALKNVLDQVVELAEELHYVIEANERKNNPEEYRRQKQQERQSANPLSQKNQQQPAAQPAAAPVLKQPSVDITTLEDRVGDLVRLVEYIKGRM